MKKILINISVVSKNHRGMGMFTKDILLRLLKHTDMDFILVSCTDIDNDLIKLIEEKGIFFKQINSPLPIFEQIILPFLIKKYKIDTCWFPSNNFPIYKVKNTNYVVTIHDIIFLNKDIKPKSIYQKIGKFYRSWNILNGIKKVDILTSVSKTALQEIYDFFNFNTKIEEKNVLYNSISLSDEQDDNILKIYNPNSKKYIYTIAGNAPHKNLKFLVDSFKKFSNTYDDFILIVSGVPKQHQDEYKSDNIVLTEFISNAEKNSLMKNADFFVFASLKEGFGIPLIEAMNLNKNILASDISVFREIGDKYVNYFSPTNSNFLIEYIQDKKAVKNDLKEVNIYIKNKFDIEITINKLTNLLKDKNEK